MRKVFTAFALIIVLAAPQAKAEYFICNGRYTTSPCVTPTSTPSGEASTTPTPAINSIPTLPTQTPTSTPMVISQDPPFAERYAAARGLKKASDDAKSAGKNPLTARELDEARLTCQSPSSTHDDCKKKVAELHAILETRNKTEENENNVTVNNPTIIERRGYDKYRGTRSTGSSSVTVEMNGSR